MASDTSKSKTEYLKRYLESEKKTNRRKRPKPSNALVSRIKIVDKNIDLKSIKFGDIQEDEDDEAPAVAEIIDERPVEVKLKEVYESSRWKKLGSAGECNQSNTIFDDGERNSESKTRLSINKKTKQPMPETNYHGSDSDCSPPCSRARTLNNSSKARHDSDSDCSPLRSHTTSIQTKRRHDSDSDISPPRRTENLNGAKDGRTSMKLNKRKNSSSYRTEETSNSKRFDSDSDLSPERARSKKESFSEKILKQPRSSDSDLSPPRKHDSVRSVENTHNKDKMKRPMKTLSGLKAGLQNARTLKEETQALREREKLQINKLNAELSGRNAETIVRDRKTGKKRDLEEENREKEEKEKRISEQQQKYSEWGKGIEQAENQRNNLSEALHEMSKPLARHCDDEELEDILKSRMRDGDPMFQHMKKKKQRENASLLPEYSGPAPPPNRFGLKPGYRWDGVDRSNGFEKKYFDKISSTKALQEEAYLWSVADM